MPSRTTTTTTTTTSTKAAVPMDAPAKPVTATPTAKTSPLQLLLNLLTILLVFGGAFVWHSTRPARDITGTILTTFAAHEVGVNRLLKAVDDQREDVSNLIKEVEILVRAVENAQKSQRPGDWKRVQDVGSEIAGKGRAWLGEA
ncbi:hypothetical protein FN846DRAFT_889257 [Sphaerosporella brunnea]|uniref:Uncharacterized protein n=1 Tax=Sphaerosporella brunnea TaxID=1250544 RepID=A0A5J5EZN2_9PEZI|nr:hypothetical protein FN846DRAFT_889257 [Sphaerosporella brunnea]